MAVIVSDLINDLDLNIFSSVFKFADDTKIISTVKDSTDSMKLQADINTLSVGRKLANVVQYL